MIQKSAHILILSVFISILLCGKAFSLCYEAAGGKLRSGSIEKYIPSILQSYEKDVPAGALFTIQKKEGFYFKICDDTEQIEQFMKIWVYPAISNGHWKSVLKTADKGKIDIIKEIGVYKVRKDGPYWEVWKYSRKGTSEAKLFVETDPQDARVRILNIRPKFYQGIELAPGKYHIEVSASGYKTFKKWTIVSVHKEERMTINLEKNFVDARKAKIDIVTSFPKGVKLPIERIIKELARHADLDVVKDSNAADIVFSINVKGQTISEKYGIGGIKRYSGAKIKCNISIISKGEEFLNKSFTCTVEPPQSISSDEFETPSEAPFSDCFKTICMTKILKIMFNAFGANILKSYMEDFRYDGSKRSHQKPAVEILLEKWMEGDQWAEEYLAIIIEDKNKKYGQGKIAPIIHRLSELKSKDTIPPLIFLLSHKDAGTRYAAIDALGNKRDSSAVTPIIELLNKTEDSYEQKLMILSLGQIGDKRAVKPLMDLLLTRPENDRTTDVFLNSMTTILSESLEKITGKSYDGDRKKWKSWWTINKKRFLKDEESQNRKLIDSCVKTSTKPRKGSQKGKLFVETNPPNAHIRILNIKPKFCQGIELKPGLYHLEISAHGFMKKNRWVKNYRRR